MSELHVHLRSISRVVLFFLSLCLFAWALLPDSRPLASGLALGALAGWMNAWLLSRKVARIAANAAERGKRRTSVGFFSRVLVVIVAVIIALRVPNVEVNAVVAGYFVVHLATLLVGFTGIGRGKG